MRKVAAAWPGLGLNLLACVIVASLGTACGGSSANGEGSDAGSPDVMAGPAATFTQVYAMMFPTNTNARCNFCHGLPANEISNGALNMGTDKAAAYAALVGKVAIGKKCQGRPLVTPSSPAQSLFLDKLTAAPGCGDRMPLGGAAFSETQLAMIRGWIAAGAKDD